MSNAIAQCEDDGADHSARRPTSRRRLDATAPAAAVDARGPAHPGPTDGEVRSLETAWLLRQHVLPAMAAMDAADLDDRRRATVNWASGRLRDELALALSFPAALGAPAFSLAAERMHKSPWKIVCAADVAYARVIGGLPDDLFALATTRPHLALGLDLALALLTQSWMCDARTVAVLAGQSSCRFSRACALAIGTWFGSDDAAVGRIAPDRTRRAMRYIPLMVLYDACREANMPHISALGTIAAADDLSGSPTTSSPCPRARGADDDIGKTIELAMAPAAVRMHAVEDVLVRASLADRKKTKRAVRALAEEPFDPESHFDMVSSFASARLCNPNHHRFPSKYIVRLLVRAAACRSDIPALNAALALASGRSSGKKCFIKDAWMHSSCKRFTSEVDDLLFEIYFGKKREARRLIPLPPSLPHGVMD